MKNIQQEIVIDNPKRETKYFTLRFTSERLFDCQQY